MLLLWEFHQKEKEKDCFSDTIVFQFNLSNFSFEWYFESTPNSKERKNIGIKTIKYLIEKKYELPLY